MIPVVTVAEAARMDAIAVDPVEVLMERAGLATALAAARLGAGYGTRVTVLCGPGNNGGDGYVAARHLAERGAAVEVQALAPPRTPAARAAADGAKLMRIPIRQLSPPTGSDLIVDAVFGGGFRRGIPPELVEWMEVAPVVAVDIPTGVDPDTGAVDAHAFTAEVTVTFGALKPGHVLAPGRQRCGRVEVVDIGLGAGEPVMEIVEDADAALPPREADAHKWSAGSVLVVGGSAGMAGAAILAARSALAFGAGAAAVASPRFEDLLVPELLTYPLDRLDEVLARFDVTVVGPGLGDHPEVVEAVLEGASRVVVDADALRSVQRLQRAEPELVLTPHAGEFARLSDDPPGPKGAAELARRVGGVVLLKGHPTFVTDGGAPRVVTSGGPELATIGTGDVLAGMVAALWARGMAPMEAATAAAYWHGVAGASLAGETTVTADRLAGHIGRYSGVGGGKPIL